MSKTGLIIGLVVAVLAVLGVAAFFLTRGDDESVSTDTLETVPDTSVATPTTPAVTAPETSAAAATTTESTLESTTAESSEPEFTLAPGNEDFPVLGTTRPPEDVPPGDDPGDLGDDPELDDLTQRCFDGELTACDALYVRADVGSDYEAYGFTCGGRLAEGTTEPCEQVVPEG